MACQNAGIPTLLYSLVLKKHMDVLEAELYFENILILIQFVTKHSVQSNTENEKTYKIAE
jgi:hypothetical protein